MAFTGLALSFLAPNSALHVVDDACVTLWRTPAYVESLPVRRLSTPQEIAASIAFLASGAASYLTGEVVSPNSGAVV